jgi:hypothetical protein
MLHAWCYHPRSSTASTNVETSNHRRCGVSERYRYMEHRIGTMIMMMVVVNVLLLAVASNSRTCSFVHAWTATNLYKNRYSCSLNRWNKQQLHPLFQQQHLSLTVVADMSAKAASDDNMNVDSYDGNLNDDDDDDINETSINDDSGSDDDVHRKRMERVWRYNKKPLLSIGAQKGPTAKHGNSLRELLQHHTTVKVKIQLLFNASTRNSDTQSIQDQMEQVYQQLKEYTVRSDPSLEGMELLQVRVNERILLVGLPGTQQRILDGTYPPPPPPPYVKDDSTATTSV